MGLETDDCICQTIFHQSLDSHNNKNKAKHNTTYKNKDKYNYISLGY